MQARPGEQLEGDLIEEGADTGESEVPEELAPRTGPPRAVIIGVAAALGAVILLGGAAVAWKKIANRGPPPAAREALSLAQSAAEKDTIASLTEAETQANAAIQAAARSRFPQAYAELAEIEVAWADALNDQAYFWGERANRAQAEGEEKKRAEADAKASSLQDQAKARLRTAFEAAAAGNKLDRSSADVALALADYYRAARSRSNLNRELKRAAALKASEERIAFVQGADFAQQDEGGAQAVEKLKAALTGAPQSARIHFRLAMAYLSMRQDSEARRELLETLKLSPQHERAKMAMEALAVAQVAPAATGEGK